MTITSPIILLLCLPVAGLIAWRSRRTAPALARGLLHVSVSLLLLAVAGIELRCNRDLRIAVLVDVSPSTRTATFRDPRAIAERLRPLLDGRAFETIYFADGIQTGPGEASVDRTRLGPVAADAILLLSDGRLDAPALLPPAFPLLDSALDAPADAQVVDIEQRGERMALRTRIGSTPRPLHVQPGAPDHVEPGIGEQVTIVQPRDKALTASFAPGDAWPENDWLTARLTADRSEQWAVATPIDGFRQLTELPLARADYLLPSVIVLNTRHPIEPAGAERLVEYVRDLGGTLILAGPSSPLVDPLRTVAPLIAQPPMPAQPWVILLDASGSMDSTAGSAAGSRWQQALQAARSAAAQAPAEARISLAIFDRSLQWIAHDEPPEQVHARLDQLTSHAPSGPTGLAGALEAIAAATFTDARLLVLTDGDASLPDPEALSAQMQARRIQLLALITAAPDRPAEPLRDLAARTGGAVVREIDPALWPQTAAALAQRGLGEKLDVVTGSVSAGDELAGITLPYTARWSAWARGDASVLARHGEHPVIAARQAGMGQVVSIVAEAPGPTLADIALRVAQPPLDPRFAVAWSTLDDTVILTARDNRGPMSELRPVLVVSGDTSAPLPLEQVRPGEYRATLPRPSRPALATVRIAGQIVARRALASRYSQEFDQVGNDTSALQALAARTGGRVIMPGDNTPIAFPGAWAWTSTRSPLAALGGFTLLLAVVILRAPYLVDILRRHSAERVQRAAKAWREARHRLLAAWRR